MIKKKRACRDAGDALEVKLECIEIQQQQYASAKIYQLRGELHLQLVINAARTINRINTPGAVYRGQECETVLPYARQAKKHSYDLLGPKSAAEIVN